MCGANAYRNRFGFRQMTMKSGSPGRSKEDAQKLGEKFICLGCEKQVDPAEEQYRRGLCEACYSEVDRAKNKGLLTYDELVDAGLMLQGRKGGRPRSTSRKPSVFSAFLAQKARAEGDRIGREMAGEEPPNNKKPPVKRRTPRR